jgi:predicted permease
MSSPVEPVSMHFSYWQLLGTVTPIFLIILVGFIIRRLRWLTREADQSLLRVCVNVLLPCLVLDSVLGNPALDKIGNLALPPLVGYGTFFLGYLLALPAGRLLRLPEREARTFGFAVGSYNYGYIPIPLVLAFYPRETMGVLFTHNLGAEIAFWTAGVVILTGGSLQKGWTKIFSPPVLAIGGSLALNLCHAGHWLPGFVKAGAHMMGQSYVPLVLVLTGATLADLLRDTHPRLTGLMPACAVALRLVLLPAFSLLLARYLPCSLELKRVIVIQAAMPAAMLPILISKHYGGDTITAIRVVAVTTLLGLVTIPCWIKLGFLFAGIF